jgi:hypothetical protein
MYICNALFKNESLIKPENMYKIKPTLFLYLTVRSEVKLKWSIIGYYAGLSTITHFGGVIDVGTCGMFWLKY